MRERTKGERKFNSIFGPRVLECAPSPPPQPDYSAAAKAQGEANVEAARLSGRLNNPNIVGPYGTQSVTWGEAPPVFDQSAYDTAMSAWNQAKSGNPGPEPTRESFNRTVTTPGAGPSFNEAAYQKALNDIYTNNDPNVKRDREGDPILPGRDDPRFMLSGDPTTSTQFDDSGYQQALQSWQRASAGDPGPEPSRDQFMTAGTADPDQPTIRQTLSGDQQKLFDQQNQIQQQLGLLGIGGLDWLQQTVQKPLDISGAPQRASGPDASAYSMVDQINKSGVPNLRTSYDTSGLPQLQSDLGPSGPTQDTINASGVRTSLGPSGAIQTRMGDMGSQQTAFGNAPGVQGSYDFSGASAMPQADEATRKSVADAILARQQPAMQAQKDQLNTQLITRGFRPGTEAWNREWQRMGAQENDARIAADIAGGQEMQRMFGMGLQGRQQGVNEAISQGNFGNAAQQQIFGQEQARGQFANQAQGQNFAQEAARMASSNAAQQQGYAQGANTFSLENAAQGQEFGQNAQRAALTNQIQQQLFAQQAARQTANNAARAQGFGEEQAGAQFQNQAQGQAYGQAAGDAAFTNAARSQNFNQSLSADQFTNTNRLNAIQEAMLMRQLPLSELNSLRTGAQPMLPQFQGYQGSQVAPAPIYAAAKDQYGANVSAANAEAAGSANTMNGLMQMGAMAAMFMSDRRLKSNVVRVGTHPLGVGIYDYDIFGRRERGVMAQELLGVKPEAVHVHQSGYLMVDYGALG